LDEVVAIFAQQVAYRSTAITGARKQSDDTREANGYRVAKGDAEAHCLLIGLQYAMPSVLPIRSTLTRQGAPDELSVSTNGMGV
jgi:hypothetical protein